MSVVKQFLSLEEVAEVLGVNYQLIYKLVRSGELPAVRVGRVFRVATPDLNAYLEKSKTSNNPPETVCTSCGKRYYSRLSINQQCRVCGEPICNDCWTRRKMRTCEEHAEAKAAKKKK
jgi:excisionase family DNA binding protein